MSKRTHRSGARLGRARQSTLASGGLDGDAMGHRQQRLERILFNELQALIRDETADPHLEGVRVVSVHLSPDGANARIGYAVEAEIDQDRQAARTSGAALERATPFLRARLAALLDLRRLPRLSFSFIGVQQPDHSKAPGEDEPWRE